MGSMRFSSSILPLAFLLFSPSGFGEERAPLSRVVIPAVAAWRMTIGLEGPEADQKTTVVQAVNGKKWRSETRTIGGGIAMGAFDGRTFRSNYPRHKNPKDGDPRKAIQTWEMAAKASTKREGSEFAGRQCVSYLFLEKGAEQSITVDRDTRLVVKVLLKRRGSPNLTFTYEYLDYDVNAHSEELFGNGKLKPCFGAYLPKVVSRTYL